MTDKTDTLDRFDALCAHDYEHNGEKRTEWLRIGRAFPNSAGGFNIRMRAVPAANNGEVVIIVRKRDVRDDATT